MDESHFIHPKHHRTTTIYLPKKSWAQGGFKRGFTSMPTARKIVHTFMAFAPIIFVVSLLFVMDPNLPEVPQQLHYALCGTIGKAEAFK
jgi:hypothetical protein